MWKYKSPITVSADEIFGAINNKFDNMVVKAVLQVGVDVNREELVKALAYDRGQYDKGYADGAASVTKDGTWERWYDHDDRPWFQEKFRCSACGESNTYGVSPYCPLCGAKMKRMAYGCYD